MERVINLARERWTLRAWQTGLSWQYFRDSTLDCCSLSQSDTDSQAVSTARFRRAGQLATADTCYYSDYWNYEMWVNLQTTVKLGLWVISEILNRPTPLKKKTSKEANISMTPTVEVAQNCRQQRRRRRIHRPNSLIFTPGLKPTYFTNPSSSTHTHTLSSISNDYDSLHIFCANRFCCF